jgi:L-alanine-DL-glutamate epimerase-like enolase superfamily enzyme
MAPKLEIAREHWPIAGDFTIARGSKVAADVVVASIADGARQGRGECVPYARYGETVEGAITALEAMAGAVGDGITRSELQNVMAPGAARNALDCALWDLEAKRAGVPAAELAGLAPIEPLMTAYTISLGPAAEMAEMARAKQHHRLLKLKLGAQGDEERLAAIRRARPDARLIIDANEGWPEGRLETLLGAAAEAGVELVEQPLPAGQDARLSEIARACPVCADEAFRGRSDLKELAGRYDAVNVKLDKAGGLTEALSLIDEAKEAGFTIMVGCMVATSLAMAPALLAAQRADYVDLDGPLLLAADREPGLVYDLDMVMPPTPELWG